MSLITFIILLLLFEGSLGKVYSINIWMKCLFIIFVKAIFKILKAKKIN